ncbi:methyltransferase domain-containing protein [Nakamurella sp. YIM 132087]|uniref:Methyltransferase domain-containing protein n=1 Tax=Nakamurella alba TaxID=2665158 RepID=A0A7K1FF35_9ACTN|nr:class I SAM-dependent methyltransferase [Nakamurella alba]MTD12686.1 methyltransferase domain-containing protein [Nakamurella alba]
MQVRAQSVHDDGTEDRATQQERTRVAYDTVAESYDELLRDMIGTHPLDDAVLAAFADQVRELGGPVLEVGCGGGRITGHLAAAGLMISGSDLSPGMIAVARRRFPEVSFDVASMTGGPLAPNGSLAGVLAWYSVIHLLPTDRPIAFAAMHAALRPGGRALVAFQVGTDRRLLQQAYGHEIALDVWRLDPDLITAELAEAGLHVDARVVRAPSGPEKADQAFLFARRDR